MFWLSLLGRAGIAATRVTQPLIDEADELISIFVASRTTASERRRAKRKRAPKPKPQEGRSTMIERAGDPY